MSLLAPTVQAFFTERLMSQRNASPRTIASYRDTLRLLLSFAQARTGTEPSRNCNISVTETHIPQPLMRAG